MSMETTTTMTDRELDAWLAEHLLGCLGAYYERRILNDGSEFEYAVCRCENGVHGEFYGGDRNEYWSWEELGPYRYVMQEYSSTGDGMLAVIEAMKARGWWFDSATKGGEWEAQFTLVALDVHHGEQARSESFPRAVAEAAKAALSAT